MMSRWKVAASVVIAVAATQVVAVYGALGDPGNTTHVDDVVAVVDAAGISVTGRATFVDVPVVVGEDATGDVVGDDSGAVVVAADLGTATISRPDPFADMLRFTVDVANQPPVADGVPEFLEYRWFSKVAIGGQDRFVVIMWAWRSHQRANQGSADPFFRLRLTDVITNASAVVELTGSMGDGVVAWNVPLGTDTGQGQIGDVGSVITSASGVVVEASAHGGFPRELDRTTVNTAYTVPGPSVRIGIAPAGTAPGDIPLTANATVDATGAFHTPLPAPATPGDYIVAAQACYSPSSCDTATTTLTVT